MVKIITVGEILVEVMAVEVGQEFTHPGMLTGPFPSGAPAIFIDQVARMGIKGGIIARVGNDDFGKLNISRLEEDGVDISQIITTPGYTTGTAFVTYFADGDRKFIYHFTHSAAGKLSQEDINDNYFKQAEYLHIMGCSLSASESMRKAIWKAVKIARENNLKISFDPNIRPELLNQDEIRQNFYNILEVTDILLTGQSELKLLGKTKDSEQNLQELKESIPIIVLKNGASGTKVYFNEREEYISSFSVKEVDPTGAGDCFDGAFLAALVEGNDVFESAKIGNAAGALSVTKKGPMEGAAFKNDIMGLIKK